MDIFNTPVFGFHLAPIARRFAMSTPVSQIGYIREKNSRVDWAFTTFNYSFILRGTGTYYFRGQMLSVQAPCVITQSPGEPMDYGPDGTWEELFLIYEGSDRARLAASGLIPTAPLWSIQDPGQLQAHLSGLLRVLSSPYFDPYVDKIDALCEMLVLESMLGGGRGQTSPDAEAVRQIETYVSTHLYSDIDFAALAESHSLHPAAFRRRWMREIGVPPARFLMLQRIREACRLLVETSMTVGEIGGLLRFEDPLYFSRKFRSVTGMTATEYRRRYRANLSLPRPDERLTDRWLQIKQRA